MLLQPLIPLFLPLVLIHLVIDLAVLNIRPIFFKYLFAFSTALWLLIKWLLLTFNLNKTPVGETGPLLSTYWLLRHPVFLFISLFPTQSVRLPLITYPLLCSTCVTHGMACHAIGHQMLPTQLLPREVEDFPRGVKYFKHLPLLTCLTFFSPKGVYMVGPNDVLESPRRTLISLSLVFNQRFKSPMSLVLTVRLQSLVNHDKISKSNSKAVQ